MRFDRLTLAASFCGLCAGLVARAIELPSWLRLAAYVFCGVCALSLAVRNRRHIDALRFECEGLRDARKHAYHRGDVFAAEILRLGGDGALAKAESKFAAEIWVRELDESERRIEATLVRKAQR